MSKPQDIRSIIEGCKANDRRCQEKLYRLYFPAMAQMCHRFTHDQDRIIDIVNNGFLRAFQKIHLYEHKGSFEGWLRRLIFHAISDYFKKENRYLKFLILDEKDDSIREEAIHSLYYEDLMSMIEDLPFMSKQVFILFAIEGHSHDEIATKLGIQEGTSKWHLSNARKILKDRIQKMQNNEQFAR
mgnify:CR=1 FL=1